MPLDFGLLSMTELRTRPGEILDRVAERGEAFIIERNGERKACLVPLSVLLPDISPTRIADEIQLLVDNREELASQVSPRAMRSRFSFRTKLEDGTSAEITVMLHLRIPQQLLARLRECDRRGARPIAGRTAHFASMAS